MYGRCSNCSRSSCVKLDPYTRLCLSCKKHLMIHGSLNIPKPNLKSEMELAHNTVISSCNIDKAKGVFDRFVRSFSSSDLNDPLRRLCWLQFIKLKSYDGDPLMRFIDVLVQSLAVSIYEKRGGQFDNKQKQYQYCLGRASVCSWNCRRQVAQGTLYNRSERRDLQRRPRLMLRAFDEIFIKGGISQYITKITNKVRN